MIESCTGLLLILTLILMYKWFIYFDFILMICYCDVIILQFIFYFMIDFTTKNRIIIYVKNQNFITVLFIIVIWETVSVEAKI